MIEPYIKDDTKLELSDDIVADNILSSIIWICEAINIENTEVLRITKEGSTAFIETDEMVTEAILSAVVNNVNKVRNMI